MNEVDKQNLWKYERGEGRRKHRWQYDYAGFVPGENGAIGKCPKSITEKLANEILNQGVPYYDDVDDTVPAKLYVTYKGVVYELVPTQPGISWHGYPWRGDLKGRRPLPAKIRKQLKKQAEHAGFAREFEQWIKKYT